MLIKLFSFLPNLSYVIFTCDGSETFLSLKIFCLFSLMEVITVGINENVFFDQNSGKIKSGKLSFSEFQANASAKLKAKMQMLIC